MKDNREAFEKQTSLNHKYVDSALEIDRPYIENN